MQGIMKKISLIIMLTLICFAPIAHSEGVEQSDPGFVILDVLVYRPLGVAVTVLGTSLFIAMSPLTALASIPEPHDAFEKTSRVLVLTPATDTFVRPLGNRQFVVDSPDYLKKPAVPEQQAAVQKPLPKPPTSAVGSSPKPVQSNPSMRVYP